MQENPDIAQGLFKTYVVLGFIYGLSIILGSFFLTSAIGLIQYKVWGRKVFVGINWVLIIVSGLAIILYIIYSDQILTEIINEKTSAYGFEEMTNFMKTMLGIKITSIGILLVLLLRSLLQIIRRFKMEDYNRLFS